MRLYLQASDYKQTSKGLATLNAQELLELYNPQSSTRWKGNVLCNIVETIICHLENEYAIPTSLEEAESVYRSLAELGIKESGDLLLEHGDYEAAHDIIEPLSIALWKFSPQWFFPYFYVLRFTDFVHLADAFDIATPINPRKADHRGRYMYYWELCKALHKFRTTNDVSNEELTAFLYDFAPRILAESKHESDELPKPLQAWMIGGRITERDIEQGLCVWQTNAETRRGDILVHYETYPISAITHIWRATSDGISDPFFHYAAYSEIDGGIETPHIGLSTLKADPHFANHPLVRKNFQGVNGWPLSADDYTEILRLLSEKGLNTELVTHLYAPKMSNNLNIKLERDVETQLLEPLLAAMGWLEGRDYVRQVDLQTGRGHRIYPDYALHYSEDSNGGKRARVVIEAKLSMQNNAEVEAAFCQGRSYTNLLTADVLVTCDKCYIYVYPRQAGYIDRSSYHRYTWSEMEDAGKFSELKRLLAGTHE